MEEPTSGSDSVRIDLLTPTRLPAPGKTSLVNVLAVSALAFSDLAWHETPLDSS